MPDRGLGQGFLDTATTLLAKGEDASPYELRRAVSSCYYAVFHCLAAACADALVGSDPATRSRHAWIEVYRGLEHGRCYTACEASINVGFPEPIKQFAQEFMQLQKARHRADYDPVEKMDLMKVTSSVSVAEGCISALTGAEQKDMVAFASWLLITTKGAIDARARAREDKKAVQVLS